jgi:hypothetical protein
MMEWFSLLCKMAPFQLQQEKLIKCLLKVLIGLALTKFKFESAMTRDGIHQHLTH